MHVHMMPHFIYFNIIIHYTGQQAFCYWDSVSCAVDTTKLSVLTPNPKSVCVYDVQFFLVTRLFMFLQL